MLDKAGHFVSSVSASEEQIYRWMARSQYCIVQKLKAFPERRGTFTQTELQSMNQHLFKIST